MPDYTIELAKEAGNIMEHDPEFELAYKTPISAVVFRYLPKGISNPVETDTINKEIKTQLLLSGKAIIEQTSVNDRAFLKFTLLNPVTTIDDGTGLLDTIKQLGKQLAKQSLVVLENKSF